MQTVRTTALIRATLLTAALVASAWPHAQAAVVNDQGSWLSTLQGRDLDGNLANGYEAYYDTALDVTWLADANYAMTSGYDTDGRMNWVQAQYWARTLNVYGTTGWRLPDVKPVNGISFQNSYSPAGNTDFGYNITSTQSELAHLYYVTLGNKGYINTSGNSQSGWGLTNTGPFKNIQNLYWYNVPFAPSSYVSWIFSMARGQQDVYTRSDELSAWAVHPGDVGAVPEPQAFVLTLAGLGMMGAAARVRQGAKPMPPACPPAR